MLLASDNCGLAASLDLALGVNWSSFENRGHQGSYFGKDFANHFILPLLTRVADTILDERNVNFYQNIVLVVISIIVLGVLVFGRTWLYAKRHFLRKMNLLFAHQPNGVQQPKPRFANDF